MEFITVLLLLGMQVKAQDIMTDITASGDGDGLIWTTSYASLIDDNGDIQNISMYDSISSTVLTIMDNETEFDPLLYNSTPLPDSTKDQTTSTSTSVETTMSFTLSTDSPTTISTTDALTTTSTVKSTTTTEAPVTTKQTTTTTVKPTTKRPSTTTLSTTSSTVNDITDPEPTFSHLSEMPTTYIPANKGIYCSFMDDNLSCDEDIVCYGEGEINCEEVESSPVETTFAGKMTSSTSADYSDYEAAADEIETFPPYLVGVKSDKKSLPFLFRMGPLETTAMDSEITNMPSTEVPFFKEQPLYTKSDGDAESSHSVPTSVVESTSTVRSSIKVLSTKVIQETTEESTQSTISLSSTQVPNSKSSVQEETEASSVVMSTMPDAIRSVQNGTSQIMTAELSSIVTEGVRVHVRRKRDRNAESASLPFHMEKKWPRKCLLTGNLVCTPSPTTARCKGKTLCKVVSGTAETSEKSTSPKGVESWAIAVIAICAIAAALTVSLLVYLIFTSWKKLKVQPQNGVTTLNYVNSSVP